jgi:hypothetical protein
MRSGERRSGILFLAAVVALGGMLTWSTPGSGVPTADALRVDVPETCPVTAPGDDAFTPVSETPDELSPGDDQVWYGTPELWTTIPSNGQVRSSSWLSPGEKTFWWSEYFPGGEVEGSPSITVTAEHLDGLAPNVKAGGPGTNGFHPDLGDFMLIGVALPATGCWELTAEYKEATLSYTMWIPED